MQCGVAVLSMICYHYGHSFSIDYLEQYCCPTIDGVSLKGISDANINLCCLCAIGLRGKEVGEYTGLKRHYIISSEIRRKLGLTEHQTNLNKYIQGLLD